MLKQSQPQSCILLIEDEPNISLAITHQLKRNGYIVEQKNTGQTGLSKALEQKYDIIILDIMLPDIDGFTVCEELRKNQIHTPILMLTAQSDTEYKVKGIQLGADDYLVKPFHTEELLARVSALLRRSRWDRTDSVSSNQIFHLDHIEFDLQSLHLKGLGKTIDLTLIEAKLLHLLVIEQNRPLTRVELLQRVWGLQGGTQTRTLDNFIMRLRNHLHSLGGSTSWIESVRGVGYRLCLSKNNTQSSSP